MEKGLDLGVKALVKTMDTTTPAPNKIEIVIITKEKNTGEVRGKTLKEKEIEDLLKKNGFNVSKQEWKWKEMYFQTYSGGVRRYLCEFKK